MNVLWLGIPIDSAHRRFIQKTVLSIIIIQELGGNNTEWPWSQAFILYMGSMGKNADLIGLNLSTVVIHKDQVYEESEWQKQGLWSLSKGFQGR